MRDRAFEVVSMHARINVLRAESTANNVSARRRRGGHRERRTTSARGSPRLSSSRYLPRPCSPALRDVPPLVSRTHFTQGVRARTADAHDILSLAHGVSKRVVPFLQRSLLLVDDPLRVLAHSVRDLHNALQVLEGHQAKYPPKRSVREDP